MPNFSRNYIRQTIRLHFELRKHISAAEPIASSFVKPTTRVKTRNAACSVSQNFNNAWNIEHFIMKRVIFYQKLREIILEKYNSEKF